MPEIDVVCVFCKSGSISLNQREEVMGQKFITMNHFDLFDSTEFIRPGDQITLKKDLNNPYDNEAIVVRPASGIKVGYVANSVCTVAKGSYQQKGFLLLV